MKIEFSLVYHLTMSRNIASANHPCPQALALAHAHMHCTTYKKHNIAQEKDLYAEK